MMCASEDIFHSRQPEEVRESPGSPWLRDLYEEFAPVRQEAINRGCDLRRNR